MGRKIGVVQKFIRIQSFGQNWRRANGIRVEYVPRIHHVAAQPQSSTFTVDIEWNTREFHRTDYLHVRCSTTSHGDLRTTRKNANQMLNSVLFFAKRFGEGQRSGSEKKWYSTHECKPQGERDRVAEQLMITCAESQHPVFRSTSPLSRGVFKSKGGGKLSIHFCWPMERRLKLFFAQLFPKISSGFTEQSQICVMNTKLCTMEREDPMWEDNRVPRLYQVWSRQTCFWLMMILHIKNFYS